MSNKVRRGKELLDTGLALKPSNVANDLLDVLGGDAFNLGHVAEFPVMGTDTVRCRQLKRGIAVVLRFVDFVDQRGAMIGAGCACAMTG